VPGLFSTTRTDSTEAATAAATALLNAARNTVAQPRLNHLLSPDQSTNDTDSEVVRLRQLLDLEKQAHDTTKERLEAAETKLRAIEANLAQPHGVVCEFEI
jgi:hypothetical protein